MQTDAKEERKKEINKNQTNLNSWFGLVGCLVCMDNTKKNYLNR